MPKVFSPLGDLQPVLGVLEVVLHLGDPLLCGLELGGGLPGLGLHASELPLGLAVGLLGLGLQGGLGGLGVVARAVQLRLESFDLENDKKYS